MTFEFDRININDSYPRKFVKSINLILQFSISIYCLILKPISIYCEKEVPTLMRRHFSPKTFFSFFFLCLCQLIHRTQQTVNTCNHFMFYKSIHPTNFPKVMGTNSLIQRRTRYISGKGRSRGGGGRIQIIIKNIRP